jgi:hypothetical protein
MYQTKVARAHPLIIPLHPQIPHQRVPPISVLA